MCYNSAEKAETQKRIQREQRRRARRQAKEVIRNEQGERLYGKGKWTLKDLERLLTEKIIGKAARVRFFILNTG